MPTSPTKKNQVIGRKDAKTTIAGNDNSAATSSNAPLKEDSRKSSKSSVDIKKHEDRCVVEIIKLLNGDDALASPPPTQGVLPVQQESATKASFTDEDFWQFGDLDDYFVQKKENRELDPEKRKQAAKLARRQRKEQKKRELDEEHRAGLEAAMAIIAVLNTTKSTPDTVTRPTVQVPTAGAGAPAPVVAAPVDAGGAGVSTSYIRPIDAPPTARASARPTPELTPTFSAVPTPDSIWTTPSPAVPVKTTPNDAEATPSPVVVPPVPPPAPEVQATAAVARPKKRGRPASTKQLDGPAEKPKRPRKNAAKASGTSASAAVASGSGQTAPAASQPASTTATSGDVKSTGASEQVTITYHYKPGPAFQQYGAELPDYYPPGQRVGYFPPTQAYKPPAVRVASATAVPVASGSRLPAPVASEPIFVPPGYKLVRTPSGEMRVVPQRTPVQVPQFVPPPHAYFRRRVPPPTATTAAAAAPQISSAQGASGIASLPGYLPPTQASQPPNDVWVAGSTTVSVASGSRLPAHVASGSHTVPAGYMTTNGSSERVTRALPQRPPVSASQFVPPPHAYYPAPQAASVGAAFAAPQTTSARVASGFNHVGYLPTTQPSQPPAVRVAHATTAPVASGSRLPAQVAGGSTPVPIGYTLPNASSGRTTRVVPQQPQVPASQYAPLPHVYYPAPLPASMPVATRPYGGVGTAFPQQPRVPVPQYTPLPHAYYPAPLAVSHATAAAPQTFSSAGATRATGGGDHLQVPQRFVSGSGYYQPQI